MLSCNSMAHGRDSHLRDSKAHNVLEGLLKDNNAEFKILAILGNS